MTPCAARDKSDNTPKALDVNTTTFSSYKLQAVDNKDHKTIPIEKSSLVELSDPRMLPTLPDLEPPEPVQPTTGPLEPSSTSIIPSNPQSQLSTASPVST